MTTASDILHHVFGYTAFRGDQEAVVNHLVNGGEALVVMPTGGGKSLCFQLPALCREGLTLVISPLIALMRDQVRALKAASPAISAYTAVIPTMTMAGLSGQARMTTPITSDTRPLTPRQRALRS